MRLSEHPLSVLVFHAAGCGHCDEYLPRIKAIAPEQCIPTFLLDIRMNGALADALGVQYTPTTVAVRTVGGKVVPVTGATLDGAVPDEQVRAFYAQIECAL